jgi:hypothetical protein
MLETLSIGTHPWNPSGDKVGVLLGRVANVVIQIDEQLKLVISPALKPFVQNCGELHAGAFEYAKYFQDFPEHLGVIPINGKSYNQPVHVYVDESLPAGHFQFQYRQINCSGTLVLEG